jgi:16S rRNA processing protein RimM
VSPSPGSEQLVCVAVITGAHGVRGAVKLRCFTSEPENVAAYGPLLDEQGRELFELRVLGSIRGGVVAQPAGIGDRNAAEALRGQQLFIPRARLPEPGEEEFYHEDLVGLEALDERGSAIGKVSAVFDFGAGDVIEITDGTGETRLVPFTRAAVPSVDIGHRSLIVADWAATEGATP